MLLVHGSSIALGTGAFVTLSARQTSSKAFMDREEESVPAEKVELEIEQREEDEALGLLLVQPSPLQRRGLATALRGQISSPNRGMDALFTLRQLHMSQESSAAAVLGMRPCKWLWRMPATSTIHAIVQRRDDRLLGTAIKLFSNAVAWDYWTRLGTEVTLDPEQEGLQEKIRGVIASLRASKSPPIVGPTFKLRPAVVHTTLAYTPSSPVPPDIEQPHVASIPLVTVTPPTVVINEHVTRAGQSSLRQQTIELLFLYCAQTPNRSEVMSLTALSISFACAQLGWRRSSRMQWHTVQLCLDVHRVDLACLVWTRWIQELKDEGAKTQTQSLRESWARIKRLLRPRDAQKYARHPSLKVLAGVTHLTRALEAMPGLKEPWAAELLQMVTSLSPPRRTIAKGTQQELVVNPGVATFATHQMVYLMVQQVVRSKLEEVLGLPILRSESTGWYVEAPASAPVSTSSPGLTLDIYNTLLVYALRRLESVAVATHLLDSLTRDRIIPSAATRNILLGYPTASTLRQFSSSIYKENVRTFPTFITYLTKVADFVAIDRIVFNVLSELEIVPPEPGDAKIPGGNPPLPGRSRYLYVTLLSAVQRAGRTGLAERIFRQARWAAALSKTRAEEKEWTLPVAAYVIMLNLYAAEAKKSNSYVEGWGRHALRVFTLQQKQQKAIDAFGKAYEYRTWRSERSLAVPTFLRSTAAPIVAEWELVGGSSLEDRAILRRALKAPQAADAVATLFPTIR